MHARNEMQEKLFDTSVRGVDHDHALARFSDPETSQQADTKLRVREGDANTIRVGTHRHRALLCFVERPLIAEEVKFQTGIDGIWKRVSDLKNMGFIAPAGFTKISSEGREQEVLELTDAGRAALTRLQDV